jgi:hypothetical protein
MGRKRIRARVTSCLIFFALVWEFKERGSVYALPHSQCPKQVTFSLDERYNSADCVANVGNVTVVVHDNDFAGVSINKVTAGGVSDTVAVREGGVNGSYTLVLDSEPVDNVFIQTFVNEGNEVFVNDFREGRHYR